MRPAVVAFSVVALGVLALLGSFLFKLIGKDPPAAPDPVAAVEEEPIAEPSPPPPEPPPPPPPPAWLGKAAQKSRAAPRFDPEFLEGLRKNEGLRQQAKKDGFLYREAGTDKVFLVQKGTRFPLGTAELQQMGFKLESVVEVPAGTMDHLSDRPPDRALLRENGDPRIFFFENGVKRWVHDAGAFNRQGFDWNSVRVTPSGSLGAYATGDPIR
jgi:hypothetical protein